MKNRVFSHCVFISLGLLLLGYVLRARPVVQNDQETIHELVAKGDSLKDKFLFEEAIKAYQKALILQDYNQKDEAILILNRIADLYYQRGEFELAYQYYNQVISLSESEKSVGRGEALKGKANILWRFGDNVEATKTIVESISIFKQLKDTSALIKAYGVLSGIYVSVKKYKDGEQLYQKMLALSIESQDSVNIAQSNEYLGVIAYFRENYAKAITFYQKAYRLNTKLKKPLAAALNLGNMGEAYLHKGDLDAAENFLNRALTVEKSYHFDSGIIFLYYTLGKVAHNKGQYDKAFDFYQKSLALMDKTGEVRERNLVYQLMAENYAASGAYKMAYQYHQKFSAAKDSLFNQEQNRQLEELQAKYKIKEKEQENSRLYADNKRQQEALEAKEKVIQYQYFIGLIVLVSLLALLFLLFRLDKKRKEVAKANGTKDILFRVISHDLNGPIHNIHALLKIAQNSTEEEKNKILEMIVNASGKTSLLVKDLLSWSATQQAGFQFKQDILELSKIGEECANLLAYLSKEKQQRIHNNIKEEHLAKADKNAVAAILRNLLSNAIKFSRQGGEIFLNSELIGKNGSRMVKVSVQDAGAGFSEEVKERILNDQPINSKSGTFREKGTGLGFTLIKAFVKESGGSLEIQNIPGVGGSVSFTLPAFVVG